MKTAEEIIQQMVDEMPFDLNKSCKPYIREAMDIYAKQCAEQALKDAAMKAYTVNANPYPPSNVVDVTDIFSTPILTP